MTTKIPAELSSTPGISDSSDATAITIDSSENVGIGTTSPSEKLTVSGKTQSSEFRASSGAGGKGYDFTASGSGAGVANIFCPAGYTLGFGTNSTERMRITSAGYVGVGTTDTNSHRMAIDSGSGTSLGLMHKSSNTFTLMTFKASGSTQDIRLGATGNDMIFQTAGTERMRINSSGNTMFGTTSEAYTSARLHVGNGNASYAYAFGTIANYSPFYIVNSAGTGVRLDNNSNSWTSTSDETVKENIEDIGNVLDIVKNYRTVKFNFIGHEEEKIGFIAQDWQNDFPQVVSADERNNKLGIQYTETIPVLLKAIQEQQTIIETQQTTINDLKSRIETLEG